MRWYSRKSKLKINNWIEELRISKEKTIKRRKRIKVPIMLWSLIKAITAIINKEVNKEPASKLIDKRFANVKDWKKLEKDSSKESTNRNNSNLVKKRNKRKEHNNNPIDQQYNNQFINTAIRPKRKTSIKLPTIIETDRKALILTKLADVPVFIKKKDNNTNNGTFFKPHNDIAAYLTLSTIRFK